MRTARLLSTALLLITTGCTGVKTTLKQPIDGVFQDKGVVVFSTGTLKPTRLGVVSLKLAAVDRDGRRSDSNTGVFVNWAGDTSDFTEEHGLIRMMVLDEGVYCLYPHYVAPNSILLNVPYFAFRVVKGKVTYAGSIQGTGLTFSLRDRKARDLARVLAVHPELGRLPERTTPALMLSECSPLL